MTTSNSKANPYDHAPLVDDQIDLNSPPPAQQEAVHTEEAVSALSEKASEHTSEPNTVGNLIVLAEQQGVEKVARDINAKINDLENEFATLAESFGNAQLIIKDQLDTIGSQQHDITSDLSDVQDRVDQLNLNQNQQHADQNEINTTQADFNDNQRQINKELESRIQDHVIELGNAIAKTNDAVQEQQTFLYKLEANHQNLVDLHEVLEKSTDKLDGELKAFADTTNKQIQVNRTHIDGLNALHRDQAKSLTALSEEFDLLTVKTNTIADNLASLQIDTAEFTRNTRTNFRIVAGTLGLTTLALAGAMTYLHLQPSGMNEEINQRIDSLSAVFSESTAAQAEQKVAVDNQLTSLQSRFANLEDQANAHRLTIDKLSNELATANESDSALNSQISSTTEELKSLLSQLQTMQNQIAAIEDRIKPPSSAFIASSKPLLPLQHSDWVDAQAPNHYSIQLVGVYRFPSLVSFVNQHRDEIGNQDLSYNKSLYLGRDWYNLYYGNFSSFSEAQNALANLPENIQRNGPWIRSFKSIQENARK